MKASLRNVRSGLESSGGRGGRLLRSIAPAALLLLGASSALASRVVDIRVAKHPEYTRVVFELDAKADYQVSRNEPAPGIAELVVTLDAGASARQVREGKGLVESITIVELGPSGSIARIRLSQSGLRLKEMVLREPARIVFDLLEQPAPKTADVAPPVQKLPPPETDAAPTETEVDLVGNEPEPSSPVEDLSGAGEPASVVPTAEAPQSAEATASGQAGDARIEAGDRAGVQGEPRNAAAPGEKTERSRAVTTPPTGRPAARSPFRTAPGPAAPTHGGSSMDLGNIAVVAGGIALLAALFVWWRRRGGDEPTDVDNEAFGDGNSLEDASFPPQGSEATTEAEVAGAETADPEAEIPQPSGGPIFDLSARERLEEPDAGVDLGAAPEPGAEQPSSEEAAVRLVRELERRVANLETRLDEVVDSRERVDRQVVAQTEELRVQRAAIARTQRAVRHLSRNVDDTPTEPALRDPS